MIFTCIISFNFHKTLGEHCPHATEQETEAQKVKYIAKGHTARTQVWLIPKIALFTAVISSFILSLRFFSRSPRL